MAASGKATATIISALDLILIHRKPDVSTLELVRLGSHAELSL